MAVRHTQVSPNPQCYVTGCPRPFRWAPRTSLAPTAGHMQPRQNN
eukprot:CAMPEP_0196790218 /NCGR_PEP_ID=MMETSP1104-20130614/27869_1 /TAXON_ID=33652 /ORGANISM="Cafeteria sp., Strain Caron Lab Isolate" /LENGTH=44 /DNA_ID= /DNA_START= /DNA_END= /DNA_ORIENTATION=